jgi:hypothetical protein
MVSSVFSSYTEGHYELLYARRFGQEHGYRFDKQDLLWAAPRVRTPSRGGETPTSNATPGTTGDGADYCAAWDTGAAAPTTRKAPGRALGQGSSGPNATRWCANRHRKLQRRPNRSDVVSSTDIWHSEQPMVRHAQRLRYVKIV